MSKKYTAPYTTTSHQPCGAGMNLVPSSGTEGRMQCIKCRQEITDERDYVMVNSGMTAEKLARLDYNQFHHNNDLSPVPAGLVRMMQSFLDRIDYQLRPKPTRVGIHQQSNLPRI